METNKNRIDRFISGKYSFNDYLQVKSLFKDEGVNTELKSHLEVDWNKTNSSGDNRKELNQILDRLHHKINLNSNGNPGKIQRFIAQFSKVAAVLLIPAILTIAILSYLAFNPTDNSNSWAEIHSPVGTRTKFQLPDGTVGWMNSGSTIKYPINFNKNRNVELAGEAWFDVVHMESQDFIVLTPDFEVKVLGTQFNVNAYYDDQIAEVILERGKVQILGKNREIVAELKPDQKITFNKASGDVKKTKINAKNYTSWKDGRLIFKNETMLEIANRLSRRYNTEIVLHGDSLKSSIFRATFVDENMDEICKMLSTVAPIEYKIHKRELQGDDSFTKNKIELWLKK